MNPNWLNHNYDWFEYDNETCQYIRCADTLLFDLYHGEFTNYYLNLYKKYDETEPKRGEIFRIICYHLGSPRFYFKLMDILELEFEVKV